MRMLKTLGCLLSLVCTQHVVTEAQQARGCSTIEWGAERTVREAVTGRPVYVETPSIVALSGSATLIGYPTYMWRSGSVFADSGATGINALQARSEGLIGITLRDDQAGEMVRLPAGTKNVMTVRAAQHDPRSVDVFWGTPDDASPATMAREIWHARLTGTHWGNADRVFVGRAFWNNSQISIDTMSGATVLAFPAYRTDGERQRSGIAEVEIGPSAVRQTWAYVGEPPAYVAMLAARTQSLSIAFIGGTAGPSSPMPYGVYIARSHPTGIWTKPELLVALGGDTPGWNLTTVSAGDTLHLFWSDQPGSARAPAELHHLRSSDGGQSWRTLAALDLPEPVGGVRAIGLAGDGVLVTTRHVKTGSLALVFWSHDRWSDVTPALSSSALSLPSLARISPTQVVLSWGVQASNALLMNNQPAPVLSLSIGNIKCAD